MVVNNRVVDHLEKCGFFLVFSTVLGLLDQLQNLLTVASDKTGNAFNSSGAT